MFRRALMAAVAVCLAVPCVVITSPDVAHADESLRLTSTTTYTVDSATGVVHVVVDVRLRNQLGCGYYYTGFSMPIPAGTSPPSATTRGQFLRTSTEPIPDVTDYLWLDISFLSHLNCSSTTQVIVSYDLLGNEPRSESASRINPSYAGFLAFGFGDAVTVQVVIPSGFTSETFGDSVVETRDNGNTIYTAADIANPLEFEFFVSASNNDALLTSDITTDDGVEFVLRTWPGDTEWQDFMTKQIEAGVPVLVDLIGQPWPIDEAVDVRESYTPYLYGYAGWFSAGTNELEIGEELDADTALHELSHAWFNDAWFTDRWLSEGFAQLYASKGVDELSGDGLRPLPIRSNEPGEVLLNEWGDPSFDPEDDVEDIESYGYNASFYVIQLIADEIGDEEMRDVLDAVANDLLAYRGDAAPEASATAADWKRFLDLVEEVGGSTEAAELLDEYVLTEPEVSSLTDRAAARDEYHQLVEDGSEWAAPLVVRYRMAQWNFTKATELIAAAQDALTLRDDLDAKAAELATEYPDDLEVLYEDADENLDEATAALQEQIASADALLAAVEAEGNDAGLFGSIGLIGTDLPKTLDEAKAAFAVGDHDLARDLAQDVHDQIADASGTGKIRALIAVGALLAIALGAFFLIRRRGRSKRQPPAEESEPADAAVEVGDES